MSSKSLPDQCGPGLSLVGAAEMERVVANQGEFIQMPIDEIELDRKNPRIQRVLEMYPGEPTPEQINLALGAGSEDESDPNSSGTSFEKLKQSIITCGGIIQPVILNKRPDGNVVCIEGNTRVSLYKSFQDQGIDGNWSTIPALVYNNLPEGDIDAIRLQAHLVGPRAWDPYSKAKYLNDLRNHHHLPFSAIVDYCGGRKKEVEESIDAFLEMEQYYRPALDDEGEFDPTRFSGFVELQRGNVKDTVVQEGFNLTDFSKWIIDGKLFPLTAVRSLTRILKNQEARKIFLKEGARKAMQVLEKPDLGKSLHDATLVQLCRILVEKVMALPYFESQRMKSDPTGESAQSVREAAEVLSEFARDLAMTE